MKSLASLGTAMAIVALVLGGAVVWLWMQSNANWWAHQTTAFVAGITSYDALRHRTTPAGGVTLTRLSLADQGFADIGAFNRLSIAPPGARLTNVPILADATNTAAGPLTMVILSPDLVYRLASLPRRDGQTAAETLGEVFRLLASYCSDPVVIAQIGNAPWMRIDGSSVWNCASAPADLRLGAVLLALVSLAVLITLVQNTSAGFSRFAALLRSRRRLGGPQSYDSAGPAELRDIVSAVNSHLEAERAQLENRAAVLSGVSHDLGTPATRLRLRTALIADTALREKLDADIDSMTGMIESVLTYTRAEMSVEAPRKLSLTALVSSIVSDYEDTGSPVTLRQSEAVVMESGRNVFMSRAGQGVKVADRQMIVTGRPIALTRAITNLIDNALKYGRRATVVVEADAEWATVIVQDEGSETSAVEIEALMAPFLRGDNTASLQGYGLGLTIVSTIARLHGGSLSFEDSSKGLCARLSMRRN